MGRHPVVVAARDSALPLLSLAVCVLVTSWFLGHVAEIELGPDEGLDHRSAAKLFALPRRVLVLRRGPLGSAKLQQLDGALLVALGLG